MTVDHTSLSAAGSTAASRDGKEPDAPSRVIVCIEPHREPRHILGHAKAVALAANASLLLVGVLARSGSGAMDVDPVEWDIRRRDTELRLTGLANELQAGGIETGTLVLEGRPSELICQYGSGGEDIIVVSRDAADGRWPSSPVTRGAMESDVAAVLAVPSAGASVDRPVYHKVLVPLDGSRNGEAALFRAAGLAKAHEGEVILCNVAPEPVLTEIGPADSERIQLQKRITQYNERVGQAYLEKLKARLSRCDVEISTKLVIGGDVRRALVKAIAQVGADIVVMASHGRGNHQDVSEGDVAGFILDHASVPVLLAKISRDRRDQHAYQDVRSEGVRHPEDKGR